MWPAAAAPLTPVSSQGNHPQQRERTFLLDAPTWGLNPQFTGSLQCQNTLLLSPWRLLSSRPVNSTLIREQLPEEVPVEISEGFRPPGLQDFHSEGISHLSWEGTSYLWYGMVSLWSLLHTMGKEPQKCVSHLSWCSVTELFSLGYNSVVWLCLLWKGRRDGMPRKYDSHIEFDLIHILKTAKESHCCQYCQTTEKVSPTNLFFKTLHRAVLWRSHNRSALIAYGPSSRIDFH